MIIELAGAFASLDADGWMPYHSAVEHLIQAHGQGSHIFAPSREIIESIERGCELSRTQKDILRYYIKERITNILSQAKSADITMLCVPDGLAPRSDRRNQIIVPLSNFLELENCGPSRLVTENSKVDGKFLTSLANEAGRNLGYTMRVSLELVHGGGDTTAKCFEEVCQSSRPVICFVDSDKRFFDDSLGTTAKKVMRCKNQNNHPAAYTFVMPVRELENAIPISMLFEVYDKDPGVIAKLTNLVSFMRRARDTGVDYHSVLNFIDHKKGMTVADVARLPEKHRHPFVQMAIFLSPQLNYDFDDVLNSKVVIPSISEDMLGQVLMFLDKKQHRSKYFFEKLVQSPMWLWLEQVVRTILSLGAAAERLPVR